MISAQRELKMWWERDVKEINIPINIIPNNSKREERKRLYTVMREKVSELRTYDLPWDFRRGLSLRGDTWAETWVMRKTDRCPWEEHPRRLWLYVWWPWHRKAHDGVIWLNSTELKGEMCEGGGKDGGGGGPDHDSGDKGFEFYSVCHPIFKNNFLIFGTVLDFKNYWEGSTEFPYIPHPVSLLLASYISRVICHS